MGLGKKTINGTCMKVLTMLMNSRQVTQGTYNSCKESIVYSVKNCDDIMQCVRAFEPGHSCIIINSLLYHKP